MQKITRDEILKKRWESLLEILTNQFSETETIDVEGILYLIGIQELGKIHQRFKKDDNVNIIHIGICRVLEPYGYYRFDFYDDDGWPHFSLEEELPPLKSGEQSVLIKEAIVDYFLEKEVIH
jgi:hypothetical protein